MSKPPKSTPHSDIDGVHEDERESTDAALEAGEDTSDLARAREKSTGRPPHSDDQENLEDRTG